MPGHEIIISFTAEGATSVETKGIKGAGCKAASAFVEQALGKVTKDTTTAEMNQKAVVKNKIGGGK